MTTRGHQIWLAVSIISLLAAGCNKKSSEVVIYTSVDQVFSEPILKDFEKETGIRVRMVFDTVDPLNGVYLRGPLSP